MDWLGFAIPILTLLPGFVDLLQYIRAMRRDKDISTAYYVLK